MLVHSHVHCRWKAWSVYEEFVACSSVYAVTLLQAAHMLVHTGNVSAVDIVIFLVFCNFV